MIVSLLLLPVPRIGLLLAGSFVGPGDMNPEPAD
jgi:hypothetical protein